MAELGYLCVVAALALSAFSAVASAIGARAGIPELFVSGRRALFAVALLTTMASGILLAAFIRHDFSLAYVWQTSSLTTPPFYLVTSLWGGQAGSLLFWSWLLALFSAAALLRPWRADLELMPWFTAVCASVCTFFLLLVAAFSNPFERLSVVPADGNGLNPLLQHPGMAFHPPTLYLGFVGMTIPYAFAMAALISGRTGPGWIVASRRWTLIAWLFLSIGLMLGGRWAYDVLGWGGYWAWDPVENAAFMPWLSATAFLHSVMVQERRGMFQVWNAALVALSFILVIVGTFLTRAGLVSSVHAFAESDIGMPFLVFTALVVFGSLALLWWRLPSLRSDRKIVSPISREGAFLGNNLLFMGALFAVFWGTLFPIFSEIATEQRVTVGPPYFNSLVLPVFWLLILLMALGPLTAWGSTRPGHIAKALARPASASLVLIVALFLLGVRNPIALAGFGACTLAALVAFAEIGRGVRSRLKRGEALPIATARLFARDRRRYGGYIVHIGIALLSIGVVGNLYNLDAEGTLSRGETMSVGQYVLRFDGFTGGSEPDVQTIGAKFEVFEGDSSLGTLTPSRRLYRLREDQPITIPAVMNRPLEDVYLLLGSFDLDADAVTLKASVNVLVSWVWIGLAVLVLGTFVAAWPDTREQRVLDAELARLRGPKQSGLGAGSAVGIPAGSP